MVIFYKPLLLILLASIACLHANENVKAIESDPKQTAELEELKVQQNDVGDTEYTFRCTVGQKKTVRVGCTGKDRSYWPTPHDVNLTLRCPPNGGGPSLAFVEVIFTVTTRNVNCVVAAGGIGQNYIQIRLDVYGTKTLDYIAEFYIF
ncbi:uncharacterized protein LOC131800981 [Musca domestica]|uniref:Uncharacterized protein LOC131800981 n=1 Tax=Musca domestica TaxID=7370 RepID=A0A1I8NJ62_MUSDO|nr:uncharacterized protein LOC131800981 [Musca domestica]